MSTVRKVKMMLESKPTMEGAGVHLHRAFGFGEEGMFDPFLLLDDFRETDPEHFLKGFPWHPHRGIETITYVLQGDVEHGDSLGNEGCISSGDVQWMTAGSGIIHQEMPKGDPNGVMLGFQLWANLPATSKMMVPRYRDIQADQIPEISLVDGTRIKIICGTVENIDGPVKDIVIDPQYLDITIPASSSYEHSTKKGHTVFAYIIDGHGCFDCTDERAESSDVGNRSLLLFDDGDKICIKAGDKGVRFLLVSGKPIGEPIAWRGPIVMNTRQELQLAFEEYNNGTFIKHGTV